MVERAITIPQKNELRRILKENGKSLIEMQAQLQRGGPDLSGLELMAIVDKYLPYAFQVKALEYGYEGYQHDQTDLSEIEMCEKVFSLVLREFWQAELEKKS